METIIASDFARVKHGVSHVVVTCHADETITIVCTDESKRQQNYTMTIGSDDDEFVFVNDDDKNDIVRFEFSQGI